MVDQAGPTGAVVDAEELGELLVRLGALLLTYGCPTDRLEACLRMAAEARGCRAEVLGLPTGVLLSLAIGDANPVVHLVRVDGNDIDLGRLAALDDVFNDVADDRVTLAEAGRRLDAVESAPPRYTPWAQVLAGAVASATTAHIFGGGLLTVALALPLGALVMLLARFLNRNARTRLLEDFAIGALAGGAAWISVLIDPSLPRRPLVLAGVIIAVPGLTLTGGLSELAAKNLVSGTARLMDATMVLLSLIFGLAVVATIEGWAAGASPPALTPVSTLPPPALAAASALLGALCFSVLFGVPSRALPWAVLSGVLAWGTQLAAARWFVPGPSASFLAAFAVGLFANARARVTQRPAQLYLLPGIVMLVPGCFGFVSFERLLWGDTGVGAADFFATLLTAGALAIGLLLANAALPARKVL